MIPCGSEFAGPLNRSVQTSRNLPKQIVDAAPIGIFWKDLDLSYRGCNQMYAKYSGLSSPANIVGKTDQDLIWSSYANRYKDDDIAVIRSGERVVRKVEQTITKQDAQAWWSVLKVPLQDHRGRIVGLAGYVESVPAHDAPTVLDKNPSRARRLLNQCASCIVNADTEAQLLDDLCQLILRAGYIMVWFGSISNDEAKSSRPIAQGGLHGGYLDSLPLTWSDVPLGRGPTGTAVRERRTVVNPDFVSNPAAAPWRDAALDRGFHSSMAIPLIYRGDILAVVTIYAKEANAFSDDEVSLLEEVSRNVSVGLGALRERCRRIDDLAAANEALAKLARHDELTGLPNRMAANERLRLEFISMMRTRRPYAILMMDIDHFKLVNDRYGHDVGDRVLARIGHTLRESIRKRDFVCRFGGEEFLALLPETDLGGAHKVAEKLRLAVAETVDPEAGCVTISVGAAVASYLEKSEDTAVKAADECLYMAKRIGRNKVVP